MTAKQERRQLARLRRTPIIWRAGWIGCFWDGEPLDFAPVRKHHNVAVKDVGTGYGLVRRVIIKGPRR